MKIVRWIEFRTGERERLIEIMESGKSEISINLILQEEFGLSALDAEKAIEIYNSRKIKK